jgi:predicted NBD/HSP70 family sugar kinase
VGASDFGPARPPSLADAVLRLIWDEERISRAEIARRADLSRSTVSEIVETLLATGLVAEAGVGDSRGGRRPIVLEFQDGAGAILGIDMGASHVAVILTDLRGRILASARAAYPVQEDPAGTRQRIRQEIDACLDAAGPAVRSRLVGIGIAVPSPVDVRHPDRLSPIAMPAWEGRHGLDALLADLGVPVLVDNDANLGALAERWWGAAQGLDHFAYIKIATGIGAGHVIDGRIHRGASGVGGEIGHVAIDPRGETCNCGNRGCLTTFVGAPALAARIRALRAVYPQSPLAAGEPTVARLEEAARADDPLALQVIHEVAEHLGVAIAGMLNLLNPAAVILGGRIAGLGEKLIAPLRATALRRTFVPAAAATEIRVSTLGSQGIALGAATLVLDAALHDPRLFRPVARARGGG